MALHKDLTGADLHEPKGVASASVDTVYVADGSGSGVWKKIETDSLDTSSVLNANKSLLSILFIDIGTAGSQYLVIPKNATLTKIWVTPQVATATSNTVLTIRNDAGTSMGTITVTTGAAAGSIFSLTPASNNTFTAGQKLQIETDGGTSSTSNASFTLELTWT